MVEAGLYGDQVAAPRQWWLPAVGVLRRSPGHAAGWILLAVAVVETAHVVAAAFTDAALVAMGITHRVRDQPPSRTRGLSAFGKRADLVHVVALDRGRGTDPCAAALVFPDGRLPSPRWRIVPLITVVSSALLIVAAAVENWPTAEWTEFESPPVLGGLFVVGGIGVLGAAVAGFAAFLIRWRNSCGARRRFEVLGGAPVRHATRDQFEHLALTRGQTGKWACRVPLLRMHECLDDERVEHRPTGDHRHQSPRS